ncbi:uncharacterized protein FYW61_014202 [Anableps anableps]
MYMSTNSETHLWTVPRFNHLLVLRDQRITALSMFSFVLRYALKEAKFYPLFQTWRCLHPPLQWPREVLAAGACFSYIQIPQPQMLNVYSMLDQQRKQTASLSGDLPNQGVPRLLPNDCWR